MASAGRTSASAISPMKSGMRPSNQDGGARGAEPLEAPCAGWWASQQGYVAWFGTACTAEGYEPVPSYDELVTEYNKAPYCARLIRGETWF